MNNDPNQLEQNLDSVLEVQKRHWNERTRSQRLVENISRIIGRPLYLAALLGFAIAWIGCNELLPSMEGHPFDPYPYPLLDGVLTLAALFSTTVILIAQRRQTYLEQQHVHIALQVNLLTEQKVTKLINFVEELRRDLPMVRDRVDPQIATLNKRTDAAEIHAAIEEAGLAKEPDPKGNSAGD